MMRPKTIAIVGGGFSGTLVASHILRSANLPISLKLIEKSGRFAEGIAYSTNDISHLLNVPATNMSAFSNQPDHFINWATRRLGQENLSPFLPRKIYSEYLKSILTAAEQDVAPDVHFERISDEAMSVSIEQNQAKIALKNGGGLMADRLVLALGNLPPSALDNPFKALYSNKHYVSDIWRSHQWSTIPKSSRILIIGTGLTMIDAVVSLRERHHRGEMIAISRHGLLPQAHTPFSPPEHLFSMVNKKNTILSLLRFIRQEIKAAHHDRIDWRSIVDSLRPITQQLWKSFNEKEKRRFLRHLRTYWEIHRHRMSPEIAQNIQALIDQKRLVVCAGRIKQIFEKNDFFEVCFRRRGALIDERMTLDYIVNCTGPDADFRKVEQPLLYSLISQKIACADHLGLGLMTDTEGRLIDEEKKSSPLFFTIGPLRKGELWESTAIPELRLQAESLARTLMD